MAQLKPGQRFRLKAPSLGTGPGMMFNGQEVTVREVVPADTTGAHNDTDDAVVVEWTEAGPTTVGEPELVPYVDDDGRDRTDPVFAVGRGDVPRAISVAEDDFRDLFEAVK